MQLEEIKKSVEKIKKEVGSKTLVAVSKTRTNEEILNVYSLGIRDFGENYVQELISKMDILPKDIKWHMIGHLQTNKVKEVVKRNIFLIESVDSIRLAKEIDKEAKKNDKVVDILIEVKTASDINKTGCNLEELENLINYVLTLSNVKLRGLMTIAPHTDNDIEIKGAFQKMQELKAKYKLELLSMGMSSDYKIALECGTDIVRIGTKIFGERNYNI